MHAKGHRKKDEFLLDDYCTRILEVGPLKTWLKNFLRYEPLAETQNVRETIESVRHGGLPFCPMSEGDLLFSLIRTNGYRDCLEIGFHTGSTALYMCSAVAEHDGQVTSICIDDDNAVAPGLRLLADAGYTSRHQLIQENSNKVLPEKFLAGDKFDFVFVDGWKTFDHLAQEIYFANQLLQTGGTIAFDDSHMPSVRRALRLLQRYYKYEEVDYAQHNHNNRLRAFQVLATRSLHRPYRAFTKTLDTAEQHPFQDLTFDEDV
ncbi:MAG: hypothetical protein CMM52_16260 [Rhodospirillaceae bacterium]|nr:hypothetical protein [Rhodospirillaceae bacterium]